MTDRQVESRIKRERTLKLSAVILILLMIAALLLWVDNLLVSFVLAFVINYLLAPIVLLLERSGLSRQTSVTIPFLGAGLLLSLGIYLLLPLISSQAMSLESQLPQYQQELISLAARVETRLRMYINVYDLKLTEAVSRWLFTKTAELSTFLPSVLSQSITVALLAPFLGYFMLQDGRRISRALLSMVPNNLFELALNLHHQINDQMGGFVRARFLEAAIVGLVVWLGLAFIGFPYAPLLAIFGAFTNLIPYVGPIIGAVPAILIALISPEGAIYSPMSLNLVIVTAVYFIAQLIDVVFIIPFVVARIVNLHPVTVILVIIIGAQVMGVLGMVISIPVASVIKVTVSAVYNHILDFRS